MRRTQFNTRNKPPDLTLTLDQYNTALADPQGLLWVDFQNESPEASETVLRDNFHFHPLAIQDAIQQSHAPKIDDWEAYLYIAFHAVSYDRDSGEIEWIELDLFLGDNYLVTSHEEPIPALERVWEICQRDERVRQSGADHLLYVIVDELSVDFVHTVEAIDDEIDFIEDQVFEKPDNQLIQRIFTLKRATLQLRRSLGPMREVLNKLARDDYALIDDKDQVYFRDVYDHFVRLHDIAESLRDLASGVLDMYLSVVNNRMNDIMKTLTLITTLFMPVSFLAGFFGMNFFQPGTADLAFLTGGISFAVIIVVFLGTPVLMYFWMRRRGWM
jgi:magnesium transporter